MFEPNDLFVEKHKAPSDFFASSRCFPGEAKSTAESLSKASYPKFMLNLIGSEFKKNKQLEEKPKIFQKVCSAQESFLKPFLMAKHLDVE